MEYTRPDMAPETLLEKITLEALSALALGPSDRVADIAPLEAALPLTAKAWELPEETLAENTSLRHLTLWLAPSLFQSSDASQ